MNAIGYTAYSNPPIGFNFKNNYAEACRGEEGIWLANHITRLFNGLIRNHENLVEPVPKLNLDSDDTEFMEFLQLQGIDPVHLLEEIGQNLTAPGVAPFTVALSNDQRRAMAEEDIRDVIN